MIGTLIPTHHEREHYCRSDGSNECPTFKLFQLRRAPLTQADYYALWMPPAPAPIQAPFRQAASG